MSNAVHVRVELREPRPNASREERERAFKAMHSVFKKRVAEAGILTDWKRHQFFESKSEKRRRKQKEAKLNRQKLREHFG